MSGQIQIQVSFSPKIITLQKSSIKTGQGLIAEITCTVTGEPKPKVTWYKGDEVIIVIRMIFMYLSINVSRIKYFILIDSNAQFIP